MGRPKKTDVTYNKYTHEDRVRAAIALVRNGNNVNKTSREVKIPQKTLNDWVQNDICGFNDLLKVANEQWYKEYGRRLSKAIDLAITELTKKLEDPEVVKKTNMRELATTLGIMTDKKAGADQRPVALKESGDTKKRIDELAKQFAKLAEDQQSRQEKKKGAAAEVSPANVVKIRSQ